MSVLAKARVLDRVEVVEDGSVQIRYADYLVEDGVRGPLLGYHREAFAPGDAIPAEKSGRIHAVAATVWTPDVVEEYRVKREAAQTIEPVRVR